MARSTLTVAELVEAARDFVRRAVGLELDLSVESLAFVDHYLSTVTSGDKRLSDEVLALVAPAIGAYFGEVAISHLGGRWDVEGEASDWQVVLEAAPVTFRPAGMVAEAVRHEEVDGYDASIGMPKELEQPVSDALAAAGPVEEDYYYSLTGRLETIEHVLEVIAELRRRRLDRN